MNLLVDATLILRWGPQIPTGIPRIEIAIVRMALERNKNDTRLFCFDRSLKKFRLLLDDEVEFVERSLATDNRFTPSMAGHLSLRTRFREVRSLYALNPSSARETHRLIAQYLVASPERSGVSYQIAKSLVRARFALTRDWRTALGLANRGSYDEPLGDPDDNFLISLNTGYISEGFNGINAFNGLVTLIVYDTIPLDYPEFVTINPDRFRTAFERFVSAAGDIVCISQATADSVRKWCQILGIGLEGKSIRVARLTSPLQESRDPSTVVPELAGRKFVAYCSTIEPRKNHYFLLKLWSSLVREIGVENLPMLVLVGRWGWKYDAVEKLLHDDEVLNRSVKLYSYLPDGQLIWVYQNAQYTVFPSVAEGWGLGAAESLDFGTPVIIADAAALREATRGLMPVFRFDDEDGWKAIIRELALNPAALAALQRLARDEYPLGSHGDDLGAMLDSMKETGFHRKLRTQAASPTGDSATRRASS